MAESKQSKTLDYATAPPYPPPLKRRDSLEYYRESPISASWSLGQIVIFIICLIAGIAAFSLLLARLSYGL